MIIDRNYLRTFFCSLFLNDYVRSKVDCECFNYCCYEILSVMVQTPFIIMKRFPLKVTLTLIVLYYRNTTMSLYLLFCQLYSIHISYHI
jgi:hypothetical protein